MQTETRHDISTGGVVLSIYRLGNPYRKSDEEISQWLEHQYLVAAETIAETFEAAVNRMADPRITTINWADTCQISSTQTIDGTIVMIKLTINGISQVPYGSRMRIARRLMAHLEEHAIQHLVPMSPEEEFARYLAPVSDNTGARTS